MITVSIIVKGSLKKTWDHFTNPEHIIHWNFASEDWCSPWAKNDLRVGGKFASRMEAKDGSFGFDFEGIYTDVELYKGYTYELEDGRKVIVTFEESDGNVIVREDFDVEDENTIEQQQYGWQCILDNFKKYSEYVSNELLTFESYFLKFPKEVQEILEKIRLTIHEAAPAATEKMSYQMPTFFLKGNLVHFAAYKKHIGFYPAPSGIEAFIDQIKVYKHAKGSVQFDLDQPIPYDLIRDIVKYRVKENIQKAE